MKIKILLTLVIILLMNVSCVNDKYEYDNLFPEKYNVVFSIKNGVSVSTDVSNKSETSDYLITLLKGGAQPSMAGDARLEVWTKEELDRYEVIVGRNLEILPADSYTLDATDFHFVAGERWKDCIVSFKSAQVAHIVSEDDSEVTYVLPLRLVSDQTVDENKKNIIIEVNIVD